MDSLAESVIGKGRIIMNSEFCIAVHGLVFLKLKKQCLSSEALAENICTNPARVRKVMAKLAWFPPRREARAAIHWQKTRNKSH